MEYFSTIKRKEILSHVTIEWMNLECHQVLVSVTEKDHEIPLYDEVPGEVKLHRNSENGGYKGSTEERFLMGIVFQFLKRQKF